MKTKEQIQAKLEEAKKLRTMFQAQHSELNQIDMSSREGSLLRKKIANMEGRIDILNWLLEK